MRLLNTLNLMRLGAWRSVFLGDSLVFWAVCGDF